MKTNHIPVFLLSSFIAFLHLHSTRGSLSKLPDERNNIRRILHQPPPPSIQDLPDPADQAFFHEHPNQSQHSLPTPVSNSVAPTPTHNSKRVAIGITSGILTLTILSALAFYLHKCRSKHSDQARKLFTPNTRSSDQESELPPSTFLYIGTVDPTTASVATERANGSPYRKLKPGKVSERYRPSPDLQPLPPLPKPSPPPPEDESSGTGFHAPHGSSSVINASPNSNNNNNPLPLYRRASPKSRPSAPSPDTRPSIIPSIKQFSPPESSSLGPLQPSKTLAYAPKYAAPPPDTSELQSIIDQQNIPIPPPPPLIPVKFGSPETNPPSPVVSEQVTRPADSTAIPGVDFREDKGKSKPKLKALHWDKVRATSEKATVWDQLKSSSVPLNEDAMESLFRCNSDIPNEAGARKKLPECILLDPKKSQNIAILIRALNVTSEEVSEALLDGNPDGLSVELLETLVKMAPTNEEEIKLKDYNDISRLGSAEQFLKRILNVPFTFRRAEAMLYRANFDAEVAYLRNSFRTLEEASEELKSSRLFLKLLEAVLQTGNRMNDGTNRGDAKAFKLDTLLKLADVKGADGKTTLLHFVVQEIIRKQGLEVVSGLRKELGSIGKAAGMDSDVLRGYVCKLETGLEKVRLVTRYEGGKFSSYMKGFLKEVVGEIGRIKAEEGEVMLRVRELTEYFHGDAAKEEAHPLRIFSIVRDFLQMLNNVCRDVQDATIVLEI